MTYVNLENGLALCKLYVSVSEVQWIERPRPGDWDFTTSATNIMTFITFFSFTKELEIGPIFLLP